jgi:hypothetical protein
MHSALKTDETALPAMRMATGKRCLSAPAIFHSDRSIQYADRQFSECPATRLKLDVRHGERMIFDGIELFTTELEGTQHLAYSPS